ncbi:DNA translocase FtsK [Bacillus rubiinfantis]|uniref:DNA translocase FtsK n=1 Tax=Bacillus rubiinfantis TaxID=1499680 RepID=UPI0009E41B6C|nr:DNA translocase FtsK [Bacillus rubiinfantis]
MSWFQDLFQKFKKDEEDESDKSFFHNDKSGEILLQKVNDSLKDVEAKVSYQYPRGSTAISRQEPLQASERVRQRTRSHQFIETNSNERHAPKGEREQQIKEVQQSAKIRQPFHPTDIPSPVFGFKRPQKTSAIVEHELSNFDTAELFQERAVKNKEEEFLLNSARQEKVSQNKLMNTEEEHNIVQQPAAWEQAEDTQEFSCLESENPPDETAQPVEEKAEPARLLLNQENIDKRKEARKERSHLPFNVMMLKQDKQKWELKQQTKAMDNQQKPAKEPEKPQKPANALEKVHESVKELEKTQKPLNDDSSFPHEKRQEAIVAMKTGDYHFPNLSLLHPPIPMGKDLDWLRQQELILNQTLENFHVGAAVVNVTQGPSVTRFEVQPEPGVKVNKITNLSDDIKLSLAARDIRIEAPIPGKHTIGIEVPNRTARPVPISEIIGSGTFNQPSSPLTAVLGLDIAGMPIVTDLKKMPHGLIAGATGSGKSVCINSILVSLLYKATPEDLRLLLIDPKMVELAPYNHIPHLVSPVITDVKAATAALKWAVDEMERRYELFAHTGVRDINRFNELALEHKRYSDKLPYIVIIIDELADLMMMSPADVEEAICRIAQKARACGIHLIIATQRPSVDVITGLIKANIPTRIAFSVSSQIDSRTIIDISGAERLLGRGDMLFLENGSSKPVRLQGTFVSDEEIDLVVEHVRNEREPDYLFEQEELLKKVQLTEDEDELFYEACEFIVDQCAASTSSLQRRFKIGYNRAARLMDMLEQNGYITSANGSKPREVLISAADLEAIHDSN